MERISESAFDQLHELAQAIRRQDGSDLARWRAEDVERVAEYAFHVSVDDALAILPGLDLRDQGPVEIALERGLVADGVA